MAVRTRRSGRRPSVDAVRRLLAAAALASLSPALAQPAQEAPPPEPRFEIRRFVVEGATLLSPEEIDRAVKPFTGPDRDFADVQRALEALERSYTEKGYSAVQVILPEQELAQGEVRFRIIEATIGRVFVEGNRFFDEKNVRASLPSVRPGQPPNIREIADNLRVVNESPAKQATVLLRGGSDEGLVDAVVRVTDERPTKYSITFDNTGTAQTGIFRVGFGFQHANLLNRDHVLSAQYVTSPSHPEHPNRTVLYPNSRVFIVGATYRIPLYGLGDSLDFTAGHSNVNSGVVQDIFNVSGSGTVLGARYTRNLPKWGEIEQRLSLGIEWRAYRNEVVVSGTPIVPDVTVSPVTISYAGVYRGVASETSFNVSVSQNLAGGNDGGTQQFEAARPGAPPGYMLGRYGLNHLRAFANDWQMRFGFNGQITRDKLVPGEQFGAGGADSVRGFQEREVTNDNGFRGTIEFYTPDYASKWPFLPGGSRLRSVFFYDWARTLRFQPLPGENHRSAIASWGFGWRFSRGGNTSLRVDYAIVTDAGGSQGRHDGRLHASFAYIF